MHNQWTMILAIGHTGQVRRCFTAHQDRPSAEAQALDTLDYDRDAERVHVLLAKVEQTGLRTWRPCVTFQRRPNGEVIELEYPPQ